MGYIIRIANSLSALPVLLEGKRKSSPVDGSPGNYLLHRRRCSLPEDQLQRSSIPNVSQNLCCPICMVLLDRPVELGCGSIICMGCCRRWIQHHQCSSLVCPCCYNNRFDSKHIRPPPVMVDSLLKEHKLPCGRGCGKVIRLESCKMHVQNKYLSHYEVTDLPSKVTCSLIQPICQ